jgi:hypothetical protein
MIHAVRMAALVGSLVLCTALPFLPGRYDGRGRRPAVRAAERRAQLPDGGASALALVQFAAVDRLASSSRDRAIRNSAPLIADVEAYRARNSRDPSSLLAVWPDVSPDVAGIPQYLYEPSGEGYNLVFEQLCHCAGAGQG